MPDKSLTTNTPTDIQAFLDQVRQAPSRGEAGRGRLIFALDATASRQPSWDRAAKVQSQMFVEAERLGGLEVQLLYYRGFAECRASRWVDRPAELVRLMSGVMCRAGETQIARVLRHALKQATEGRVHALVFVGDACEESVDELGHIAGELALRGVKAFLFREGDDAKASLAFGQIALLTGGAHCRFDASSPDQLRQLLGAVAAYAAGGRQALLASAERAGGAVRLLARQVRYVMLFWLVFGVAGVGLAMLCLRWFASVPPGDLVRAARTFVAVFGTLAGSGLMMMGRGGLAFVFLGAAFMAGKALWGSRRPPDPMEPGQASSAGSSTVSTALLAMRLDRGTGALDGEVRAGKFAGRALATLRLDELLVLLGNARNEDPPSVALLETYLDRRFPDWRAQSFASSQSRDPTVMDEATALEILGLERGAEEPAIRAAHRRLMSRVHPDHGGSDWLAARINQARDFLLKKDS